MKMHKTGNVEPGMGGTKLHTLFISVSLSKRGRSLFSIESSTTK